MENLEKLGMEAIFLLVDNFDPRIQAAIGTSVGMAYHTYGLSTMHLGISGFDNFARNKLLDRYNVAHAKVLEFGCLAELETMLETVGKKRSRVDDSEESPATSNNPASPTSPDNGVGSSSDSSSSATRPRKKSNILNLDRDNARGDVAKIMLKHWIGAGFLSKRKTIPTKLPPMDVMWKLMREANKLWAVFPGFDQSWLFLQSKSYDMCKKIIDLDNAGGLKIISTLSPVPPTPGQPGHR